MINQGSLEQAPSLIIPDKVAMIDIDGTLIDKNYAITDGRIYRAIQDAQNVGWTIGLSSDTPHETMQEWHHEFGMNGPIIAEKGAFVAYDNQFIVTSETPFDFVKMREDFLAQFGETDIILYRGDAVKLMREGLETIGKPGDELILANIRRQHSVGYFARRVDMHGRMIIDEAQTNRFADQMRVLYPNDIRFHEDLNIEHGLFIVSHLGMHKRVGTIALENLLGINRIAMIGNSIADYVGTDIASQLAVGDATDQYKQAADYVSGAHLTSGVVEALSVLVKNNR